MTSFGLVLFGKLLHVGIAPLTVAFQSHFANVQLKQSTYASQSYQRSMPLLKVSVSMYYVPVRAHIEDKEANRMRRVYNIIF